MTSVIKISPVPTNITEEQIKNQIGSDNITKVVVIGDMAYVTLQNQGILEKLAGKYGDDLKISQWASTITPLESTFDLQSLKETITQQVDKVSSAVGAGLNKTQNIIGNVVEGVRDMIGSGINKQLGPTVNFREYNEKLAVWLITFLN